MDHISDITEAMIYLNEANWVDLNAKDVRKALQLVLARHFNEPAVHELAQAINNGSPRQ